MQVITASRASIHAPDGAAALALEHRLAQLHAAASHNGGAMARPGRGSRRPP